MLALAYIDQDLFDAGVDGGSAAWLHDEIILEVPADDARRAAKLLEDAMVRAWRSPEWPGRCKHWPRLGPIEGLNSNEQDCVANALTPPRP